MCFRQRGSNVLCVLDRGSNVLCVLDREVLMCYVF